MGGAGWTWGEYEREHLEGGDQQGGCALVGLVTGLVVLLLSLVIITDKRDWGSPVLPLGSAGSLDLHLNPHAWLVFTGLKLLSFGTKPVFISALSCLVSADLTYRFMRARPPRCSPTRPLQPATLLFGLCSLQQFY